MNNIKKIVITLLALTMVMSACNEEEFYELEIPFESPWQSVQDFDDTIAGAYYSLTGFGGNQSIFANRRAFAIASGDEGVFLDDARGENAILSFYDRDPQDESSWLNVVFNSSYATIGAANIGLDFLENDPFTGAADVDQLIRQEGELRFIRAFSYWSMAKAFLPPYENGGSNDARVLPLRLNGPTGLADAVDGEPGTAEEIYQLILSDLTLAKELLPEEYDPNLGHPETYRFGRVNKFTAAAMLSRVHFQMGNFAEALAEANFVIDENGGRYDLTQDPIEAFNKTWDGQYDAREVLWLYSQGATPRQNGLGTTSNWKVARRFRFFNFLSRFYNAGNPILENSNNQRTLAVSDAFLTEAGWINPADRSVTAEAMNDKRYTQLFLRVDPADDPDFTSFSETQVWNNRYYRWDQGGNRSGQGTSFPVIRLPEVYLTRALLNFQNGNAQAAADDLNVIRARAWDADAAGEDYTPLTAGEVTEALIHKERMIELAFEGDRLHYLQALKIAIPSGDRGTAAIPYNDPGLYWPIPLREAELNTAID